MVDEDGDILPGGGQLEDLEPHDDVVLGVDGIGGGAATGAELAAADGLGDWDGGRKEAAGRGAGALHYRNLQSEHILKYCFCFSFS